MDCSYEQLRLSLQARVTIGGIDQLAIGRPIAKQLIARVISHACGGSTIDADRIEIVVAVIVADEGDGLSIGLKRGIDSSPGGEAKGEAWPPSLETTQRSSP